MRKLFLIIGAGLTAALAVACNSTTSAHSAAQQPPAASQPAAQAVASSPAPADTTPAAPSFTVPQQQAIASAESYLSSGQGFSKAGLIKQLHSKYGEGFSKSLAVFAVNHVRVNWRHQAVVSAKGYMSSQPGWSYSGLVNQLSSPYGEDFTLAQAQYAAHAVGL